MPRFRRPRRGRRSRQLTAYVPVSFYSIEGSFPNVREFWEYVLREWPKEMGTRRAAIKAQVRATVPVVTGELGRRVSVRVARRDLIVAFQAKYAPFVVFKRVTPDGAFTPRQALRLYLNGKEFAAIAQNAANAVVNRYNRSQDSEVRQFNSYTRALEARARAQLLRREAERRRQRRELADLR